MLYRWKSGPGDIQHLQIFETGDATHVVIAVEYGADAIFVFDRDVGSSEDQHEVSGIKSGNEFIHWWN